MTAGSTGTEGEDCTDTARRAHLLAYRAVLQVLGAGRKDAGRASAPSQTLDRLGKAVDWLADAQAEQLPVPCTVRTDAAEALTELVQRCRTVLACRGQDGKADPDATELAAFFGATVEPTLDAFAEALDRTEERMRRESQQLLFRDRLTGLCNARAADELGRHELSQAQRVLVVRVDLERLAALREAVGRHGRDEALRHTARTLQTCADSRAFVARVEDGSFLLVQPSEGDDADQQRFAGALVDRLNRPFDYDGGQYQLGAKAGLVSGTGERLLGLVEEADLALLAAKGSTGDRVQLFNPDLRRDKEGLDKLINQLKAAIEEETFEPHFQPQVQGRSGKLVGLEALIRWPHPTRGVLDPHDFLAVAERAELLDQLDRIMLKKVCAAAGRWLKQGIDVPRVSINLSEGRLFNPEIVDAFRWAADANDVPPDVIGIEILESVMLEGRNREVARTIEQLSAAGFLIELDDFGTGHASIAKLRNFQVDRIKIDRSFVRNIHLSSELSKITGAMIGLAHSMRIDALAEGVETPEERLVLNALGCDHIQGFGVAYPIPEGEVAGWIARTQRSGADRRSAYRLRGKAEQQSGAESETRQTGSS